MEETLEIKILKYLKENRGSDFIDVSHLSENNKLLKGVIKDLKDNDFIATRAYPPKVNVSEMLVIGSHKPNKCKIKLSGIEYLKKHLSESKPKREKWYNQNWVGYVIAFIVLFFGVYQYFDNRFLKNDSDSLRNQYEIYKDSTFQLKKELEKQKQVKLLDTLQTND